MVRGTLVGWCVVTAVVAQANTALAQRDPRTTEVRVTFGTHKYLLDAPFAPSGGASVHVAVSDRPKSL